MGFVGEARAFLKRTFPEIQKRTKGYVPRTLIREDVSSQEVAQLSWLWLSGLGHDRESLSDSQVTNYPRLAVIGNAGSGKSYILQNAYLESARTFLCSSEAPFPCFLDLCRHLSARRDIEQALNHRYQGLFDRIRLEHDPGCVLFLDALDERLLSEQNHYDFINELCFFLENHQDVLSSVVLACRRVFWNADWFRDPTISWGVYQADYLDFRDYRAIIPDPATQEQLFHHADELGIADLLRLPFIGFDLARRYNQGQDLPESRQGWFRERIETSLRGSVRDQERGQAPPLDTLLFLSKQLACLATFGRVQMWTEQEAVDQLGASEVLRHEQMPLTHEQVRTLFQRPLFTKTGDRFSFCHQLFREYLAADALRGLPLLKQRQLLEAPPPGFQYRILTPHRGVAVFLAEMEPKFCEYLIETDPLVAFFAELSGLPSEADERLIKAVIDQAIATHRTYWWEIPPRGERPLNSLPKHRPRDVAGFVRPYLERTDEIALLWGTACAGVWGGSAELNNLLIDLAHSDELNTEIRKNAVDAVFASGEEESIRELYDLLDSQDDRVRGHVLRAYRMTESPTPTDFIAKLYGGAHNDNLHCLLQSEASAFGLSLDSDQLQEAFQQVSSHFEDLGNLRRHVLQGLFRRAVELGFEDIPPSLIVNVWLSHDVGSVYYEAALKQFASSSRSLFPQAWSYVMDELGRGDPKLRYLGLGQHLGEVCSDQIFDLLPADRSVLNWDQDCLVQKALSRHFSKEPTAERLQVFQEKAPAFTAHLRPPPPASEKPPRDPMQSRAEITRILNDEEMSASVKASQILSAIAQMLHGDGRSWVEPREVIEVLGDLPSELQERVLETYEAYVFGIEYSRRAVGSGGYRITRLQCAVPFWVLWNRGFEFPADKLDEFIRCYAFSRLHDGSETELFFPLLDKLHNLDPERWSGTVVWLVDFPHTTSYGPMEYLITTRKSDLYVDRCRQRLRDCDFNVGSFDSLLDYWVVQKPTDFEQVLHTCYECLDDERQRVALLYTLLTEDDDWAWEELRRRVEAGNPPLGTDQVSRYRPLRLPLNPSRLPVLADWYAHIRRERGESGWPGDLGRFLLETIVRIGGEDAIGQLQRLQDQKAFPDAEWLSHAIFRIEDQMLSVIGDAMEPAQLLDFVNREALGVVLYKRDLFEWVCRAIEEEKESLERQGYQVSGYWNCHDDEGTPKTEPQCQNLLWPRIKSRLTNLGIVGVEERFIRTDKVDFWVEKPLVGGESLQVAIELKVARKGYGPKRLVAPLWTQLWEQYLQPSGCQHGIYVVLWFKDAQRYRYPTNWTTPQELLEDLNHYKQEIIERHHVNIACYVIDMTTTTRLH